MSSLFWPRFVPSLRIVVILEFLSRPFFLPSISTVRLGSRLKVRRSPCECVKSRPLPHVVPLESPAHEPERRADSSQGHGRVSRPSAASARAARASPRWNAGRWASNVVHRVSRDAGRGGPGLALPQPGSTSPRVTGLLRLCGEQQQTWGWCGGDLAPATTWPLPQPAGTERTRGGSSRPVCRLPGSTRCSCLVLEFGRCPRARGPHPGRWLRSLRRYSRVARSRRGSEGVHEPTSILRLAATGRKCHDSGPRGASSGTWLVLLFFSLSSAE